MKLFCFGMGYTARSLVLRLGPEWVVTGTSRNGEGECLRFDRNHRVSADAFEAVTHILVSIPPDDAGDPVRDLHGTEIGALPSLQWLGYLSTTGVYGTRDGGWVDEASELRPTGPRGRRRVAAEAGWEQLRQVAGLPVHVFRLSGIYGPGRSAFDPLRTGTAKRIDAGGQVFSRIHVDDIANVLLASITQPRPGAVYNVCDDEPAAQEEVIAYAARLLGMQPPPLVPLAEAELSPMAHSFWADNKRVSNALIKSELGVHLAYPTYREGLAAILAAGG
ncbi:MAG TPA: SDR family oxidoreductase [Stellaceae bacterium]|nr:SDR family oxidoreductase [Stellaceae bacterium]